VALVEAFDRLFFGLQRAQFRGGRKRLAPPVGAP
jgi:hypothetical protein